MQPTASNLVKIGKNFNRIIKITNGKKIVYSFERKSRCVDWRCVKKTSVYSMFVGFFQKKGNETEGDIWNYGFAGEGHSVFPVNEETIYDLASLTKPLVTSLCLLALLQEGQLSIDDTICKYFR